MIRPLSNEVTEVEEILRAPSEGLSWSSPWSSTQIREEILNSWSRGLFEEGQLIAFIFARQVDNDVEITNLGTLIEYRRRGLMRKLLGELLGTFSNSNLWLEVHEANQPAIRLYESLKFIEVGRRRRYYTDGAAAVLMKRTPKDGASFRET